MGGDVFRFQDRLLDAEFLACWFTSHLFLTQEIRLSSKSTTRNFEWFLAQTFDWSKGEVISGQLIPMAS